MKTIEQTFRIGYLWDHGMCCSTGSTSVVQVTGELFEQAGSQGLTGGVIVA